MDKLIPIRMTAMTYVPIVLLIDLPNSFWGIVFKFVAGIFLISAVLSSFNPSWPSEIGLGAFTVFNSLFFGLAWYFSSHWSAYIFSFLIVLCFLTIFQNIENWNNKVGNK